MVDWGSSTRPSTSFARSPDGCALELWIGIGRIALPLLQRNVPVHGIELSNAMVARLRAKRGVANTSVTVGDFATTVVRSFSLAYLVFNAIMNLTMQVSVPDLQRLPPGETIRAFHVGETRWGLDDTTS